MKLPGLGPKTAARIWRELGVETLDELKAAAEGERLRALHGPRGEERGEDPQGARVSGREREAGTPAARRGAAGGAGGRRGPARAPGRGRRLRGGLRAPPQGELPRPRHHRHGDEPGRADRLLHGAAPGSSTSPRTATRRRRSSRTTACASTCASCRRSLREPAPALHRLEGAQRRDARGRRAAGASRSPSTACTTVESGRRLPERGRGRGLRVPRLPADSARSCARTRASWRRRGAGSCPRSSSSGDVRGDLHAHTHWSADGKSTLEEMVDAARRARLRVLAITDHSHYLRDGRLRRPAARRSRALRAPGPEAPDPRGRRGEHPSRAARSTCRRTTSRCCDWVVASVHSALDNDPTERVLEAMREPVRGLHRPSHRPADRHAAGP